MDKDATCVGISCGWIRCEHLQGMKSGGQKEQEDRRRERETCGKLRRSRGLRTDAFVDRERVSVGRRTGEVTQLAVGMWASFTISVGSEHQECTIHVGSVAQ